MKHPLLSSLLSYWPAKLAFSLWALFLPVIPTASAIIIIVTIDTLSGSMAAIKRGEHFCSREFGRVVRKLAIYLTLVLVGFIAQKYLTGELLSLLNFITSYIGITETISICENLNELSNNKLLQGLINRFKNKE